MKELSELQIKNNLLPIPPEILEKNRATEILSYYFLTKDKKQKQLSEAKVIVVGQGSVGKTSLVNRTVTNKFDIDETKTEGISIRKWEVHPMKNSKITNSKLRINIWDFGGQEIMHATHQFFLTKRSLYLLVLDARLGQDENRVEYWLRMIQSFGGDSPVIVVGNKIDQQPLDIDRRGLQAKYPNIKAFVETSCLDGRGIDELKEVITTRSFQSATRTR